MDQLSIGYGSYGSQTYPKNERQFFRSSGRVITTVCVHHLDADQAYGKKVWRQLHKGATSYIK